MSFNYPYILLFLIVVPFILGHYIYTYLRYKSGIAFPSIKILKSISKFKLPSTIRHMLFLIKLVAISILIIAAARPQGEKSFIEKEIEVVDIMLIIDISDSMEIKDMNGTTRFQVAKDAIKLFISKTKHNRLGLIAFGGQSFTLVPLTKDYNIITSFLEELKLGDLPGGTAIGMALANATERLKKSKTKSKVIVLLTDGENTAGSIAPEQGMMMAKELGIKIHTIALSSDKINESNQQLSTTFLEAAAQETGGKFYRVFTETELGQVYSEINRLEKTKIKFKTLSGRVEYFKPLIIIVLILLLSYIFIDNLLFRVIP